MLLMPTDLFFLYFSSFCFSKNVFCFMPPLKLEWFPIITFTWHLYASDYLMQQQHFYYASVSAIESIAMQMKSSLSYMHSIHLLLLLCVMQCLCYAHENNFSYDRISLCNGIGFL